MASYEEALHLLRYRNWNSRSLLDRKFKLVCSELNGRYTSNEFQVEVSQAPLEKARPALVLANAMLRATGGTPASVCPRGAAFSSPEAAAGQTCGGGKGCLSPRAWAFGGSWWS